MNGKVIEAEQELIDRIQSDDDMRIVINVLSDIARKWEGWETASDCVYRTIGKIASQYELRR